MNNSRNRDYKKHVLHRAKILRGQMEGVIKLIEKDEYCPDILRQSLAIQRSLRSLDELVLKHHLQTHVKHQMRQAGKDHKAVQELVEIYHLANR